MSYLMIPVPREGENEFFDDTCLGEGKMSYLMIPVQGKGDELFDDTCSGKGR